MRHPLFCEHQRLIGVTLVKSHAWCYCYLFLIGMAAFLLFNMLRAPAEQSAPVKQYPLHIASYPPSKGSFISTALGQQSNTIPPVICNLNICDLDGDKKNEVLICDTQAHALIKGYYKSDAWVEEVICADFIAPAKSHVCDYDGDGDLDIIVAELGDVFPNNKLVGSIVLLQNNDGKFTKNTIASGLGRVADVRSADFNNDKKLDLAVAVFGHGHGEVLVLTQNADGKFDKTQVLDGPGCIHTPIADYNNDGHLDIACVLSQDEEEVWILFNDGSGSYQKQLIFQTLNDDFGSAGLVACDIDNDGDQDLLLPHGDNLEEFFHYPQQHHGCLLLRNNQGSFEKEEISNLPGCYAASVGDIDHDQDTDIVLVSMVNDWRSEKACSVAILRQEESGHFVTEQLASNPIKFITCAVGDINHDGINDIICGGFHIQPPFEKASRLHAWLGQRP